MTTKKTPQVLLRVSIDNEARIAVTIASERGLSPLNAFTDLLRLYPEAESLTLEARDFYQDHTLYEVYGAILDTDGATVHEYWIPTANANGKQCTIRVPAPGAADTQRLVVGARPRRADMPEPAMFGPLAIAKPHHPEHLPDSPTSGGGETGGGSGTA